jgi:hypothetical protein
MPVIKRPRTIALTVNSFIFISAGTYGRNFGFSSALCMESPPWMKPYGKRIQVAGYKMHDISYKDEGI